MTNTEHVITIFPLDMEPKKQVTILHAFSNIIFNSLQNVSRKMAFMCSDSTVVIDIRGLASDFKMRARPIKSVNVVNLRAAPFPPPIKVDEP